MTVRVKREKEIGNWELVIEPFDHSTKKGKPYKFPNFLLALRLVYGTIVV
ncbi:MAG: hypothetical protein WCY19_08945 [Candidatus Gastranaerophilaceae bacterium]